MVLVVAFALRLPYLWQVPRFTDELQEILWALAIYRGEILPLTAVDSYYGPVWSYLLAGVFLLERIGAALVLLPRITATVVAVATIAVGYGVAREIAGHRPALFAAALMATSGGHIIINSHTARSNSVTPLLTTLLVWALVRGVRTDNPRWMVAAGALFGLALQTHVSVIAFVPGLAIGVLLLRPRWLISPWAVGGVLAVVGAYANMLIYNLQTGFWSLVHARALQSGYTDGQSMDPSSYFTNLGALIESLSRLVSGTIDEAGNPAAPVYLVVGVAGLLLLARGRMLLPLLFCLSAAVVLPYFNPRYGPILSGRYIVPLLPFLYLGIAVAAEAVVGRVPHWGLFRQQLALRVAAAVLVLFPLGPLGLYYREVLADERTNASLFELAEDVRVAYRPGDLVLVDEALAQEPLTAGGTDLKAMRVLLEAHRIPYEVAKLTGTAPAALVTEHQQVLTIMSAKKADTLERRVEVTAQGDEVESASGSGHDYAVYRLHPRLATPDPSFAGAPLDGDGPGT